MKDEKFTWVETHKKITQFISTKENSQQDLIDLLKSVGIGPFNDKSGAGEHDIELDELDPFTFFCYIYKYGTKRRLKYLQEIAKKLNIEQPAGESGIPSAQAQKVWLFPYKYERTNKEVSRLWNLFNKELNNQITDQDFADALQIRSTGKTKLTEALFYVNPEKYLPINGPTKPYLNEVLGIDPKFNSYNEYLEILAQIKEKTDIPFYELSYEAWKWNDERKKVNYWIFQGNPNVFDFETALRKELLTDWTVRAHKDKIKVGDKVILWITGNLSGCYALAEVTSEPHEKTASPDDHLWKGDVKSELKANIKITHNLVDYPILKENIESLEELKDLKVGNQGTNFSATEEEYSILMNMLEVDSLFSKTKSKFDSTVFNNYINILRKINAKFALQPNDDRIVYSVRDNRLNFTVGQRYCFNLYLSDTRGVYGVISKDRLLDESEPYDGNPPQPFYNYFKEFNPDSKEWDSIIEAINDELKRTTKSGFRRHHNSAFENYVFEITKEIITNDNKMNLSLNTILYGPPGTGKTYRLKNEFFEKFTTQESTVSREEFVLDKIKDLSWWEIIALSVLELGKTKVSGIFNHELVQLKAKYSHSTTVTPTIWGQLQSHTIDECESVNVKKRSAIQIFNKTQNSEWEILIEKVKEQIPDLLTIKDEIDNFKPTKKTKKRYVFTTFHQSFSYEDFIEGIKPVIYENEDNPEIGKQVIYEIKPGLFKQIVKEANQDRENDYAIFIDEINRGNIANIFGELITLIEDDKRIDKANYIPVKLPYSNDEFGVPPNLYIIGTMNTADRSVEALDTALRRRFSFIEMNPEPKKLSDLEFKCDKIDLEALLTAINARIEKLLDKDYCIGHSYFMTIKNRKQPLKELKIIFQNKILPLLQEYFYGDWGKIMLVIGKEFIDKKIETIKFLSNGLDDEYEEYDEKPIYNFTDSNGWTIVSFKSIYE